MSGDDRGSATPFAVACLGVLVLLAAALGVVAALIHAHRQAQGAADLAALAAARAIAQGADGCGEGGRIATANGARLLSCEVSGREVRLRVEVAGPRWLGQTADLGAEARAGPG
ncbi:Rv3654c family TadE-like protein [Nocardioides sp. YIM 152315]|uniref:Rv3654c family TadE-like protein n=1 Tax=Nocardioides sp. YIM 152315 TaxID=3031760 RepID=UPI0023DB2C21|nr:Rv3654c family TadE-like protein [Nocardioides sp. YIM 152315]MDF1603631.1 flp pilus-assembly TadE/G-like family protein [Nocardioides sp. YIM 152315]